MRLKKRPRKSNKEHLASLSPSASKRERKTLEEDVDDEDDEEDLGQDRKITIIIQKAATN